MGTARSAAASGERARVLDRVELEDGDGPCARATASGAPAEADLAQCVEEWPRFGALAADFGLVTAIGLPIETPAHRGALNVFAFTELSREARQLLPLLADQVMTAVANAELYESSQALAGHLERALETRGVIERAKGVLIARQGCDPDQAFDILRRASQRLNRKLHDIATDLVANATTGEVPDWAPWTAAAGPGRAPTNRVPRPTRERPPGPPVPVHGRRRLTDRLARKDCPAAAGSSHGGLAACYVGTRWRMNSTGCLRTVSCYPAPISSASSSIYVRSSVEPGNSSRTGGCCRHRCHSHPSPRAKSWRRMMVKPKAIQWLEEQTGQNIPYDPEGTRPATRERHLSVRLDRTMASTLDVIAAERGLSVSQLVRDIIADAVDARQDAAGLDARALVDRLAADVAEVRRRLAG